MRNNVRYDSRARVCVLINVFMQGRILDSSVLCFSCTETYLLG